MNKLKPTMAGLLLALTAGAQPQTASAPDLDWIAGHWCQETGSKFVEEYWLPARGGLLLGVGRTVAAGQARSFEFLRIKIRDGQPVFIAQPDGVAPTPFALTASGKGWARFENPAHDFPKRVEYRRTEQGLHAEIAGPGKDGRETVIPFEYLPCAQR